LLFKKDPACLTCLRQAGARQAYEKLPLKILGAIALSNPPRRIPV